MIYGIGTDILRHQRVVDVLERHGERFAQRILMPRELELYAKSKNKARFLSMRFAAKEAVAKALGTGFAHGIWVRDIGVVNDKLGRPEVIFSERGQAKCDSLSVGDAYLTLSDEGGMVVANAILLRA